MDSPWATYAHRRPRSITFQLLRDSIKTSLHRRWSVAFLYIDRDLNHKDYVPKDEYDAEFYPEYLSGVLYAFPTKQLSKVVYMAQRTHMTFNDEVELLLRKLI